MIGGCRNKNDCRDGSTPESGVLRLGIKNANGTDYLETHPNVNALTCAVYKEDWSYANMEGKISWERMKTGTSISSSLSIEYIGYNEPVGVDITKTFYVKLDKDIDTLKVTFRQKNQCFELDNFRAYYNGVSAGGYPPNENAGDVVIARKK